tara:strand:+ start:541 stop:732 length:192 start_codon:yes stop_codon:yes gene_type:complete
LLAVVAAVAQLDLVVVLEVLVAAEMVEQVHQMELQIQVVVLVDVQIHLVVYQDFQLVGVEVQE